MGSMLTIYHGSNVILKNPKVLTNGFYKDFGYGFYCTNLEKQAQRWALTKRNKHVVNIYSYEPDNTLNILKFTTMTDEWLNLLLPAGVALNTIMILWKGQWRMIRFGIILKAT